LNLKILYINNIQTLQLHYTMSYVPPHLRNNKKAQIKPNEKVNEKVKVNDFPELVKAAPSKPAMDFSKLFNKVDEEVTEKKDDLKRGIIKLTKSGIVDSLTIEEREQEDLSRNKVIVSKNMADYYIQINHQREQRLRSDNNYSPESVHDEYSSSNDTYYSTEESEYAEDDPEQEMTEF
jgi:hypothetical protein